MKESKIKNVLWFDCYYLYDLSYKLIPLCNQYTIDNILHLHHKHDHDKQPFDLKKAAKLLKAYDSDATVDPKLVDSDAEEENPTI